MSDTKQQMRQFLLKEIEPKRTALGIPAEEINDSFELVGSGIVDSLGFIELVGAMESEFNFEMDFEELDPAQFTTLGGFLSCAADCANPS